jgi:hypothetical protein
MEWNGLDEDEDDFWMIFGFGFDRQMRIPHIV